jgi:uncharacterized protein with von Willebrand factor type A (vWA) domain
MRDKLLGFVDALRAAGLRPSVAESLDAAHAVAAAGVERPQLRECLAATLVKDHADRPTFDEVFDRYFALPRRDRHGRERARPPRRGEGAGRGGMGPGRAPEPKESPGRGERQREEERGGQKGEESRSARRLAERRALAAMPFRDMGPLEAEELRDLAADLGRRFRARWARRQRRARRGRLDIRRTIRRALSRGGVPLELLRRRPRPGKTDLFALVDLSFSTATAAEFLLAVLAPARAFFRRVALFGYVDTPVEISFERGHLVPHQPLDLNARSDFGRVLSRIAERHESAIGRDTVFLILGDARNNRRPPRADLLAALRRRARALVWLNPESPERWDTGDSVMSSYARHVDLLLDAHDAGTLTAALGRLVMQ